MSPPSPSSSRPPLHWPWLLLLDFGITAALQCSCFAIAFSCQCDTLTDLAATTNFALLALLGLVVEGRYDARNVLVASAVGLWALRLGAYLLRRVLARGHDARFDAMRRDCRAFFGFWLVQILWVLVVSLPVILLQGADPRGAPPPRFGHAVSDLVGLGLWIVGFAIEWAADRAKAAFHRRTAADEGGPNTRSSEPEAAPGPLTSGLWRWSRHPNYFGEILCWLGITVLAAASLRETGLVALSLLSPALTIGLLLGLSGVPLAEDRNDARFGHRPAYRAYKAHTSVLIPFPPTWYHRLPSWAKVVIFLEFPMYSRTLRRAMNATRPPPNSSSSPASPERDRVEEPEAPGTSTTYYQTM